MLVSLFEIVKESDSFTFQLFQFTFQELEILMIHVWSLHCAVGSHIYKKLGKHFFLLIWRKHHLEENNNYNHEWKNHMMKRTLRNRIHCGTNIDMMQRWSSMHT